MNIFYEMASRLGFYKDVKNCLLKGFIHLAFDFNLGVEDGDLGAAGAG